MSEHPPEQAGRFTIGLLLGFVASCFTVGLVAGIFSYATVRKGTFSDERKRWSLRPVVVYAVDIPAGARITFDLISQRSMPEFAFDEGLIVPAVATRMAGRMTRVDTRAGDPARWTDFASPEAERCFETAEAGR